MSILFRDSSADATRIPARSGWRITAETHHEAFLQVKAFRKATQPRPGSKRYTAHAVKHTAPYALVHNNENPR